ncbi:MAG TPA: alpha/beta hydrolase [Hyphomicrobiales bacterium]|nr:alpha/beta hydrolase [Hyphomicrobiales bacterium]
MILDPHAKRLLDMLGAAAGGGAEPTLAQRRQAFANLMRLSGRAPAIAQVEDVAMPGPGGTLPLRLYRPAAVGTLPALVFFHGGGLVAGSLETHDAMVRTLAAEAGCAVVAVGYRLAPEHRFPAAFEDCATALRRVAEHAARLGLDPHRVGVAGDSVGGGLAAAVALAARDGGGPRLALQVLLYPVLDQSRETASRREFARGYFLDRETVARDLADCCPPGTDLADPRLSPLRAADLGNLPPAIVVTAGHDPMRDEGEAYADALAAAGVSVVRQPYPGMIHHFLGLGAAIPHAREAWRDLGAAIRRALG